MKLLLLASALVAGSAALARPPETTARQDPSFAAAERAIAERAARLPRGAPARARNVILFVGDGMGVSTITAARIFAAQQAAKAGNPPPGFAGGEENWLSFERFPASAMVRTWNTDAQVPDSAGTATAMTTGIKTRIGVLGIRPDQGWETCATPAAFPATLARLARDRGLMAGVVTTTRITHATPAAMFAHIPSRNAESADRNFPETARAAGCPDIARQMLEFRGGLQVMLGGGRDRFLPQGSGGRRDDGRDLLAAWQAATPGSRYLASAAMLAAADPAAPGPVLGLFNDDHLSFRFDREADEPSLPQMAVFAVRKLEADSRRNGRRGWVLMVEAGRIDHAHHMTNAMRALDETVELAETVTAVLKEVDLSQTLVLVTADHSHVFTIAGYPPRGNDILGYIRPLEGGESRTGIDAAGNALDRQGRPMPTLSYANGPAAVRIGNRQLDGNRAPTDPDFLSPKTFELDSETHSGEDVTLHAIGPGSALVSGVMEQNAIFHVIARALGWR